MSAVIGLVSLFFTASALAPVSLSTPADPLTFERRVEAQRAIERVYYSHQVGARLPFDEAVTLEFIEKRVRTYLKQSAALEHLWRTPVTAQMLHAEAERMARATRMPERLRALQRALGDVPFLVQECLVRPALVDRLARSAFRDDRSIHARSRREAGRLREEVLSGNSTGAPQEPRRHVVSLMRSHEGASFDEDEFSQVVHLAPGDFDRERWLAPARPGQVGEVADEGDAFVFRVLLEEDEDRFDVAIYSVPKMTWDMWWAGVERDLDEESLTAVSPEESTLVVPVEGSGEPASCPPDDVWSNGSLANPPFDGGARYGHTAVWSGSVMIVWGGSSESAGARYDPATDLWSPTSSTGAPSPRGSHTAVWAGDSMIVWGGSISPLVSGDGARYDPATDTWSPVTMTGAPAARTQHSAVWTGSRMIVWGGTGVGGSLDFLADGGAYDPATNTWSSLSLAGAPAARRSHAAVWTGSIMVIWGGSTTQSLNTGGRYNPGSNTWSATRTTGAPDPGSGGTAVWTGIEMVLWGGAPPAGPASTGARYDPVRDRWSSVSTGNAPSPRYGHSAVWTGSRMIVWGGYADTAQLNSGGSYDPAANSWMAVATAGAPGGRNGHTAIWTGTQMVVYGGSNGNPVRSWGLYDPSSDAWPASSTLSFPTARLGHSAVWTGNVMIVWGGEGPYPDGLLATGARYDPAIDAWFATSTAGAPSARKGHTAVWTGSTMVINGGYGAGAGMGTPPSGARYNPINDTWQSVSTAWSRFRHTAVWTGARVLLFGGATFDSHGFLVSHAEGVSYDPVNDVGSAIALPGAPSPRYSHTAVWTGNRMIVWGGCTSGLGATDCVGAGFFNDGRLYDPGSNTWSAMSQAGAPAARNRHTAVWTGERMIVWGGVTVSGSTTGGRYDPATDTWEPTSENNAPSGRSGHTAVWSGREMIIWAGSNTSTGGRYSPSLDQWKSTSTAGAPSARSGATAVWDGGGMIVWGGTDLSSWIRLGGRYLADVSPDADGDGASACMGDCDDTRASVRPGGAQVCGDGLNNDCSSPGWPSLAGTNEGDDDGDGLSECQTDCDDAQPAAWSTPGEVPELIFGNDSTLSWNVPPLPGGTVLRYDLLRSVGADFVSAAACVESDDGSDTNAVDGEVPAPGSAFSYLVRAENLCPGDQGQGRLGSASSGTPITGRNCP